MAICDKNIIFCYKHLFWHFLELFRGYLEQKWGYNKYFSDFNTKTHENDGQFPKIQKYYDCTFFLVKKTVTHVGFPMQ